MRKPLLLLSLAASTAGAQVTIGTYTPPTPPATFAAIGPFGVVQIGQSFVAPAGSSSLTSLTYWMLVNPTFAGGGPAALSIYPFAGSPPAGPALFTQSFTFPTTSGSLNPVSFTPNIAVTPGATYIALVSTTVNNSSTEALIDQIPDGASNSTGGQLYRCIMIPGGGCDLPDPTQVASFEATFAVSAVPEPTTLTLGATGLIAVALLRRRRRA